MPREMTPEECREKLLEHIRALVHHWEHEKRAPSAREKLDGLAFSILVMLDGHSGLPAFRILTDPHPDDKEHNRENGDDWWPEGAELPGVLHDHFYKKT